MSSSKRWLDANSGADEAEREILRAGLGADPPQQLQDDILRRVLAAAPLPALPDPSAPAAAAAGPTAKAASTLALLGKGFVAGVGVSVAVAAGQHWVLSDPPRPTAAVTARPTEPRSAPSVVPAVPVASPAAAPAVPVELAEAEAKPRVPRTPSRPAEASREAPAPALPDPAAGESRRASQLEEEAALLRTARQQLREGALAAAFATLETSRQRFSALEQEREALMIELLYRSGQRSAAAARARVFLQRHPESPHRGQVQKFAE